MCIHVKVKLQGGTNLSVGANSRGQITGTYDPSDRNKWEKAEPCIFVLLPLGTKILFARNQMRFILLLEFSMKNPNSKY